MLDGDFRDWKQAVTSGQPDHSHLNVEAADSTVAAIPLDIKEWRRAERKRLLAMRRTHCAEARAHATSTLLANLTSVCESLKSETLGLYWPIKGEIEICRWASRFAAARGMKTALPVIVTKNSPLEYWQWRMGEPLTRGFWNIPVPASRIPVNPTAVIIPLIGFHKNYRLGYGGGYFDRWLAQHPHVTAIGVAWSGSEIDAGALDVQAHDRPLTLVLTERGVA
jgi:5,10-methenyltetrahydrofolate synthetase